MRTLAALLLLLLSSAPEAQTYNVFKPGCALSGTWNSQTVNLASGGSCVTGTLPAANEGAAGSDTQIQYNASGLLGASAALKWNYLTNTLTLGSLATSATLVTPNGSASAGANLTVTIGNGVGTNQNGGIVTWNLGQPTGSGNFGTFGLNLVPSTDSLLVGHLLPDVGFGDALEIKDSNNTVNDLAAVYLVNNSGAGLGDLFFGVTSTAFGSIMSNSPTLGGLDSPVDYLAFIDFDGIGMCLGNNATASFCVSGNDHVARFNGELAIYNPGSSKYIAIAAPGSFASTFTIRLPTTHGTLGYLWTSSGSDSTADTWTSNTLAAASQNIYTGMNATKSADTTSGNATLTNDADLQITVNTAGTYNFEIFLSFYEAVAGTGGFQFDVAGGSATIGSILFGTTVFTTSIGGFAGGTSSTAAQQAPTVQTSSSSPSWSLTKGQVTFSSTGTFIVRWAQNTISANVTTLKAKSYISLVKTG